MVYVGVSLVVFEVYIVYTHTYVSKNLYYSSTFIQFNFRATGQLKMSKFCFANLITDDCQNRTIIWLVKSKRRPSVFYH